MQFYLWKLLPHICGRMHFKAATKTTKEKKSIQWDERRFSGTKEKNKLFILKWSLWMKSHKDVLWLALLHHEQRVQDSSPFLWWTILIDINSVAIRFSAFSIFQSTASIQSHGFVLRLFVRKQVATNTKKIRVNIINLSMKEMPIINYRKTTGAHL